MADNTDPLTVTSKKNSLLYCLIQYKVNYLTVDLLDTEKLTTVLLIAAFRPRTTVIHWANNGVYLLCDQ